ncbi:hypothetical protein PBC6_142 [Bacillus phage PBC6]|nr:hypothetical protein PBC6_142 [Bacillus phage PBC6]
MDGIPYKKGTFDKYTETSGSVSSREFSLLIDILLMLSESMEVVSDKETGGSFVNVVETHYRVTHGEDKGNEYILRYQVRNPHTQEGTEFAYTFFKA